MEELSDQSLQVSVPQEVVVPWKRQVDSSNWLHLLGIAISCTLFFAMSYALLTHYTSHHGVKDASQSPECWWWALEDGLYFSIATETTVGYGDLAPHGISRVLACLQVIAGLVIAGIIVSYITNRPTGKLKILIERMSGAWGEINVTKDGFIISLVYIRFAHGLLRYDGMNFGKDGNFLGTFEGASEPTNWISGSQIHFDYSNEEGDSSYYTSGRTALSFKFPESTTPKLYGRGLTKYDFYTGIANDKDHPSIGVDIVGYRLDKKQSDCVLSTLAGSRAQARRSKIAQAYLNHFQSDQRRRRHIP